VNIKVTIEPTSEPLTTAEGKKQCEIATSVTEHDTFIDSLIKAARLYVENKTGIALFTQTVTQRWDSFPYADRCDFYASLELGYGEIQSITSVKYIDVDGAEQTLVADTDYKASLTSTPPRIVPAYGKSWPSTRPEPDAVYVTYVRGWDDVADIPELLKRAMLMIVSTWFECRNDSVKRFPSAADGLIHQYMAYVL